MKKARRKLYKNDPYENINFDEKDLFFSDCHALGNIYEEIIQNRIKNNLKIQLIIEVGTWNGGSALLMADILQRNKIDAEILCIDTWMGSVEQWRDGPVNSNFEKRRHPANLYQFLFNVIHEKKQNIITPFPQTSLNAALILENLNIKADMIFLDASHEQDHVYLDLKYYYSLLEKEGILFGHDYDWPGVKHDVDKFSKEKNLHIKEYPGKQNSFWIVTKVVDFPVRIS